MNLMHAYEFLTTDDHSKWAVSDQSSSWICVGDINRAVSKFSFFSLKQTSLNKMHSKYSFLGKTITTRWGKYLSPVKIYFWKLSIFNC